MEVQLWDPRHGEGFEQIGPDWERDLEILASSH